MVDGGDAAPGGEYRFRYVADGVWYTDYASYGVESSKLGGWNSVLFVPEPEAHETPKNIAKMPAPADAGAENFALKPRFLLRQAAHHQPSGVQPFCARWAGGWRWGSAGLVVGIAPPRRRAPIARHAASARATMRR